MGKKRKREGHEVRGSDGVVGRKRREGKEKKGQM